MPLLTIMTEFNKNEKQGGPYFKYLGMDESLMHFPTFRGVVQEE